MRHLGRGAAIGVLSGLMLFALRAGALVPDQQGSAESAGTTQSTTPSGSPTGDKSQAAQGGGKSKTASGQQAGQQAPPKPSTAADNPFPEEESKAAQKAATEADREDQKAANAGSAIGPGAGKAETAGSSSRDKLAGMDVLGERDSRISNGAGGTIVDPKLAAKDLSVGQQYYALGNYQGAYERFKEAVTVNPGNLDAVFFLAEAARKTAHLDESAENYRVYLEAQPDGGRAKAARKALGQLTGK